MRSHRKSLQTRQVLLVFSLAISLVAAQNTKTLAILDFEGHGISQSDAVVLTSRLCSLLVQSGAYTIIERDEMIRILQEQDFQMTGCTSNECAVEIGQILSAQLMLAGEIGRVWNYFTVECRVIDVETSRIIQAVPYDISGSEIGVLLHKGIPEVVEKIVGIGYTSFIVGRLNIITEPAGATVYLDSVEHAEQTPTTIKDVPLGAHMVELVRDMENYGKVRIAKEVDVQPGQVLMIGEEFKDYMTYGRMELNTFPDTLRIVVEVDGRTAYSGPTRASIDSLVPGEHNVKVINDTFEAEIKVPIVRGKTTRVALPLKRKVWQQENDLDLKPTKRSTIYDKFSGRLAGYGAFGCLLSMTLMSTELLHISAYAFASGVVLSAIGKVFGLREVDIPENIEYNKRMKSAYRKYIERVESYNQSLPPHKITIED